MLSYVLTLLLFVFLDFFILLMFIDYFRSFSGSLSIFNLFLILLKMFSLFLLFFFLSGICVFSVLRMLGL